MIKLFKNVTLMPYAMFVTSEMENYDCIVIHDPEHTYEPWEVAPEGLVAHADTFDALVALYYGFEESEFWKTLAHYPPGKNLAIFASRLQYARIMSRFLDELYPNASNEDIEVMYRATLDNLTMALTKSITIEPADRLEHIRSSQLSQDTYLEILSSVRQSRLDFFKKQSRANLSFEWLYFDFLINGTDSEHTIELAERMSTFIYSHFIEFHDVVVSMNNLTGSMEIPLKLTFDAESVSNKGKKIVSELTSAEINIDTFVKKYGDFVKSALEDVE